MRIVILGYIVRGPIGGLTWHHLQYVIGLAGLGHDVYFIEDSDDYPSCYDPHNDTTGLDPTYGLRYASSVFRKVGFVDRWAFHDAHTGGWSGPAADRAIDICESADLVLNLSGVNPLRPWTMRAPVRVFVDTDPVFTQIRHLTDAPMRARAEQHTTFLSFGENFGFHSSTIPDDGFPWRPTRQPVVLDAWPVTPGRAASKLTTVMQWESYPPREFNGIRYGLKSQSFEPFVDLPARAGRIFELAIGSPSAPRPRLERVGWRLRNPLKVTRDPWTYQLYIQRSKAEFGVAKHGYAASNSGWFSERTTSYLASGRPVIVQNTGFNRWLKADRGVFGFDTVDDVLGAIEELNSRYEFHCRAAREVAAEYFDSAKVLSKLLDHVTS